MTLTNANAVLTPTASINVTPVGTMSAGNDTIDALTLLNGAFIQDSSTTDSDVVNAIVNSAQTPTLVSIETVNATMGGGTADLQVQNSTNLRTVNVSGANGVVSTTGTALPTLGMASGYAGQLTARADWGGSTTDALTVNVNGTATGAALVVDDATAGVDTLTTLNLNVTANSTLALTASATADLVTTVNISGAGNLTLGAVANTIATTITAATSTGTLSASVGAGNATLVGSNQGDTFTMTVGGVTATVSGGLGDDIFNSGAFAVASTTTYRGGDATDSANGGTDTVNLNSSFAHDLTGFTNVDVINVNQGTTGATTVTLDDNVGFLGSTVTVNGASLTAAGNTLTVNGTMTAADFFLNITGGSLNDTLNGGSRNDTISGGAGDDQIAGGAGNDSLTGGEGADTITGGAGVDTITTGTGADRVVLNQTASANRDIINDFTVGAGGDTLQVVAANTTLGTAAAAAPVVTASTTAAAAGGGAYAFTGGTSANADIVVLGNGAALTSGVNGGDLSLTTAAGLDGTELLKALTDGTAADTYTGITAAAASDQVYLLAYQGGNAYLYHANDANGNGTFAAAEIQLIGTFSSVAAGTIAAANYAVLA